MTVAIADDERLFRTGIARILSDYEDIELVLEAANGQEFVDQLASTDTLPDIILLDLNMPVLNGIDAATILQKMYPQIRLIILSSYDSSTHILKMIELGAAAYIVKNSTPEQMIKTIREVYRKGFSYNDQVLNIIRQNMIAKVRPQLKKPFMPNISAREQEILQLICEEYTTTEIAEKLFISPRTVDGHRNNLLTKLNCRNTAGLVVIALQEELVDINYFR